MPTRRRPPPHQRHLGARHERPPHRRPLGHRRQNLGRTRRARPAYRRPTRHRRPARPRRPLRSHQRPLAALPRPRQRRNRDRHHPLGPPRPQPRDHLHLDLTDTADIIAAVTGLAEQVAADTADVGRLATRVTVKVRFTPFRTRTRQPPGLHHRPDHPH
ncbi:DinB/UmuC family translesion DNA polymerase [Nonomuraea glycinis]|uniref:DinB/UmuC family translesion DNA polymerase n=1 Tax=Nonomuraea glycinis TaxID=2047744 RepID=UPI00389B2121